MSVRSARSLFLLALALVLAPAIARSDDNAIVLGQRFALPSKVMNETRTVFVRTPPGYAASRERFPVFYLTDAEAQFAHTVTTIDFLARNGRMPQMIVVGVTNTDRTRDLTPSRAAHGVGAQRREFPTSGGADRFLDFFERELIPWVESTFRTQPYRVFGGHSFGGLFAVNALATRPDLFQALIAVSPTLVWDDALPIRRVEALLGGRTELPRTLVVTIGNEGPVAQAAYERFRTLLGGARATGFEWEAHQYDDEDHGSLVLRSHYAGLRKVFAGWQLPLPADGAPYTGGIAGVRAHYATLSARMGYVVAPPEALVNVLGYLASGAGRHGEALEYFAANVKTYPESANVYDSYGEGLEAAGRLEHALEQYERAVAVGAEHRDANLGVFRQHRDALAAKLGRR